MPIPARIQMASPQTELLLHVDAGRLPSVLHWGRPSGTVDAAGFDRLVRAQALVGVHNGLPTHGYGLSIVPEQWTGWSGRPGVEGSRQGRDWAPRFVVERVEDAGGRALEADSSGLVRLVPGEAPVVVVVRAVDADCAVALEVEVRMHPSGLVQARASLTNTGADGYQLDGLGVVLPVPQRATELLDLAGRWGKERVPQRRPMRVGKIGRAHV